MDDDDSVPLVQDFHQRVQFLVAQVLPSAVGRQFHAVRTQSVKRINGFADGGIHVGQRQGGAELETAGVLLFHFCRNLVHPADALGTLLRVVVIRLRIGHGQHSGADARAVHKSNVPLRIPSGQREGFFQFRSVRFQHLHVFGDNDVGVDIDRLRNLFLCIIPPMSGIVATNNQNSIFFMCREYYSIKLLIRLAGLSGVWSVSSNDLTMCSVPCLYF